jgi:hypothetical protein
MKDLCKFNLISPNISKKAPILRKTVLMLNIALLFVLYISA